MRKQFMPIVGAALLAGTLAIVGCVSVESTRAQLASSNPQEVQKAKDAIYDVAVHGTHGAQGFGDAERLEYVKLVSDNELLFRIIKDARDGEVIKAVAERIDLSKPGIGLEILQKYQGFLKKVDKNISRSGGPKQSSHDPASFSENVIATLSESELLKALELRYGRNRNDSGYVESRYGIINYDDSYDDSDYVCKIVKRLLDVTHSSEVLCKALRSVRGRGRNDENEKIMKRLIDTTQDVSLLLSFCKGGKNASHVPYGYEEKILLKLAGMPEKLPSAVALRLVTEYRGYPVNEFLVEDVALRKG